ncbi:MAG: ATPase [Rhizobiales bacterium]|nr:ATPase [Hyphomicrobiales bacterium]
MNGVFDDPAGEELRDPMRSAAQPRPLPKRFYKTADYAADGDGFVVRLDGKTVRTPAKLLLRVDREPVAAALAAEWAAQGALIDPATMPLTRLVNSAIDGVARDPGPVRDEILRYAESDLLCYRAPGPARLVEQQDALWTPLVEWMHERFGARFLLAEGIVHVPQFPETIAAVDAALGDPDPLALAALSTVNTLTGSAILTLALLYGRLNAEEVWRAAHVDEDFELELWGDDKEAAARREARWQEMQAAALVLAA